MSNETKFTKGEWFVGFKKTNVYTDSKKSGEGKIVSQCGEFKFIDRGSEESKANAHLIASAPKLYAMLEDLYLNEDMSDELFNRLTKLLAEARGEK